MLFNETNNRIKTNVSCGWEHRIVEPKNAVRALLAKRNRGEQEIRPIHNGSLFCSQLLKDRGTPRAPLREEARGPRVLHRPFTQEEVQKELLGYPQPIHNMIDNGRTEDICRQWMTWRTKTTPTIQLQKQLIFGGFVQTNLVPIQCQSDFKQALSTMRHAQRNQTD